MWSLSGYRRLYSSYKHYYRGMIYKPIAFVKILKLIYIDLSYSLYYF
jgi:hypothetical protein